MPADQLTASVQAPARTLDAVRLVLAGRNLRVVAASAGLSPADLGDAVEAYHTAGAAALEQAARGHWYQAGLRFTGQDLPERAQAAFLSTGLARLEHSGAAASWWFMRKPPGWRLRMLDADPVAVAAFLAELATAGAVVGCHPVIYEPETTAFGGPAGMDIAHALFCADSRGVLDYLRRDPPPAGRRELSVLLVSAMLATAGLDWFERGDVFGRIAAMRPAPVAGSAGQMQQLAGQLRDLLAVPAAAASPPFASGGPAEFAAPWRGAFTAAGYQLAEAAQDGALTRGLRAVLAQVVLFHWNRLGLPAQTQAILATAARDALLPPD